MPESVAGIKPVGTTVKSHNVSTRMPMDSSMTKKRKRRAKWRDFSYARSIDLKKPPDSEILPERNRLHSMGVSDRVTNPETRMHNVMVTAISLRTRPRIPAMNMMGINTTARDNVMEMMVNPIWRAPSTDACMMVLPISVWRTMFSIMTMASSTTNPTARMKAMAERLSMEKWNATISDSVPMSEVGMARLAIMVAGAFRRNR